MTTLYLKYRPQKIEELDLVFIKEKLSQLLSSQKIPHALLFIGPKGTGKTSAARIIAKVLNCEKQKGSGQKMGKRKRQDFEPCNKCSACKAINEGRFLDLIEIDAASNRGIDDIRELRARVRLAPNEGKYKVYVIDEVHMLTTQAFNALLKTLEEPPEHVIFILCTTEAHKLPETIISRCLRFDFNKATIAEIKSCLKRVAKGEELQVEDESLEVIAKASDGSFRDAVKLLEQLSFAGKKISRSTIKDFFNKGLGMKAEDFVVSLLEGKVSKALDIIQRSVEAGIDLKWWLVQVLEELRNLLLLSFKNGDKQRTNKITKLITLIEEASRLTKDAIISSLPLEVAVIEWGDSEALDFKGSGDVGKQLPAVSEESNEFNSVKKAAVSFDEVLKKWPEVLQAVKPSNHSVEALLKAARPLKIEGQKLIIEVFYSFHKERLEEAKCASLVAKAVETVFNSTLKISYILGKKKAILKNIEKKSDTDLVKTAEEIFSPSEFS